MYEIPRPVRCKNKEKYTPKKKNHTQDGIYVVQQIVYVHEVTRISLFLRKNTGYGCTVFSLKNNIKP